MSLETAWYRGRTITGLQIGEPYPFTQVVFFYLKRNSILLQNLKIKEIKGVKNINLLKNCLGGRLQILYNKKYKTLLFSHFSIIFLSS